MAFGSDLNGLVMGARPPVTGDPAKPVSPQLKACVEMYDAAFVRSKTADKSWNYCTEGVAHYGMMADFLRHMSGMPKGDYIRSHIMENAEMFARMWEKAGTNSKNVK